MPTEVVHTIKTSGGDYTSLSAWESAQQRDLVAADEIAVAECYAGDFTDNVAIAGWTTDATRYVEIRAASGEEHGGLHTAGFRITNGSFDVIRPATGYIRIRGVVILPTSNQYGIVGQADLVELLVDSCVIHGGGTSTGVGISPGVAATTAKLFNNIIFGFKGASTGYGLRDGSKTGSTTHAYNNTIIDCRFCIVRLSTTLRPKNNVTQDPGSGCFTGTMTNSEKNISSDATSPETGLRNISLTFEDKTNKDYHLASGDSAAQGAGVDLSADANIAFDYDIDGDTRPSADWDIGADQFVAPPAAGGVPSGLTLLGVGR